MEAVRFVISCGIYLRGDELDPDAITARLGIEPTRTARKGAKRHTAAGTEMISRTGLWNYVTHVDGLEFEPAIEKVLTTFDHVEIDLRSLPGVADAFLDIFGTGDQAEDINSTDFSLSSEQVARIAALNLSIKVELSIFGPGGEDDRGHTALTTLPKPLRRT